jgi:signal transduction histidine kinase
MEGAGLLDLLPVGVFACAATGEILYFNDRAATMWGRPPEKFDPAVRYTGAHRLLRRDGTDVVRDETPLALALRTGEPLAGIESILERPDGNRMRIQSHVRLVEDELGIHIGAVEVFHEPAAIKLEKMVETADLMRAVREIRDVTREVRANVMQLRSNTEKMVEVASYARALAERFADRALAVDSSIHIDAPEPVVAIADVKRVDSVLSHMIEDALGHARGRRVDVRVLRADQCAEVSVSNHGFGTTFTMSLPLALD